MQTLDDTYEYSLSEYFKSMPKIEQLKRDENGIPIPPKLPFKFPTIPEHHQF
jgi:hypothetical protein